MKNTLKDIGRKLIGPIITGVAKSLDIATINTGNYRGLNSRGAGSWFFSADGRSDFYFSFSGVESCIKAFEKCAPAQAIILKKVLADANGKIKIVNTQGKAKGKEATGEVATAVNRLLSKPNPLQSGSMFTMMAKLYIQTFGHCIILPSGLPAGFPAYEAKYWWILPPNMYDVTETESFFLQSGRSIDRIVIKWNGYQTTINHNDCLILRDVVPNFSSMALPASRLKANEQPINNIIGAYESRGVIIDQRGPDKIISSDKSDISGKISLSPTERQEIQEDFANRYGLRKGQWRQLITNAAIKVDTIGFNMQELMLFEEIKDDIERIADSYQFPVELLAGFKSSSMNSGTAGYNADKMLYQNAILPESEDMMRQISEWLGLRELGLEITRDFSHVAALQENRKEQAEARRALNQALQVEFRNNVITLNRWRELLGEEPATGGDVYYSDMKDQLGTAVTDTQNNNANGNSQ